MESYFIANNRILKRSEKEAEEITVMNDARKGKKTGKGKGRSSMVAKPRKGQRGLGGQGRLGTTTFAPRLHPNFSITNECTKVASSAASATLLLKAIDRKHFAESEDIVKSLKQDFDWWMFRLK
jgi:hypothetical protein